MYIGIVADDLTGAADSVAPFAWIGLESCVGLSLRRDAAFGQETAEALALDTRTRDAPHLTPTQRSSAVRRATRRLIERAPTLFYKKIDSTLRGYLRLELEAMRGKLPDRLAIVCPAFPANGRTVENGILHIQGVPWTETDFAPTRRFDSERPTVRAAFDAAQEQTAADIPLDLLRQGVEFMDNVLKRMAGAGLQTIFCDAVTPADLDILAAAILRHPQRYLPVGSAGLAAALAEKQGVGCSYQSGGCCRCTAG